MIGSSSWTKLEMPELGAQIEAARLAWDHSQCADGAAEADPRMNQIRDAHRLLASEPERAFAIVLALANQDFSWAMLQVAWCFEFGLGTATSQLDAEAWYRRARDAGCERAILELGRTLAARGALDQAIEVYSDGVAREWAPALSRTAILQLTRATTAPERRRWRTMLERAAELGSPNAKAWLARGMAKGWFGIWRIPLGFWLGFQVLKDLDRAVEP
jgi:TPR repeat protein